MQKLSHVDLNEVCQEAKTLDSDVKLAGWIETRKCWKVMRPKGNFGPHWTIDEVPTDKKKPQR